MIQTKQQEAVRKFNKVKRMALFSSMGTGKTKMALDCISSKRALVVGPLRPIKHTWPEEIKKWHPNANIDLINYESLHKLQHTNYDMVVFDESTYVKNPKTKRFKRSLALAKKAEYVLLLTGTPMPRNVEDIWAQIYLLDFGKRLGTLAQFRNRFMTPIKLAPYVTIYKPKPFAHVTVQEIIKDITFSFELELEVNRIFETVEFRQNKPIQGDTLIETLHALSTHSLAKAEWIKKNGPSIVGINFRKEAQMLKDYLPNSAMVIGNTRNTKALDLWNQKKIDFLILHPGAAGYGLNLQYGGSRVIWHSLPLDLEQYDQLNARVYRMGQDQECSVTHCIYKGSLEEKVNELLKRKDLTQKEFLRRLKKNENQ